MDQKKTKSHFPGQYLDIALVPGQYLDIALAAGQYKIYCPALAFDLPTQSVTYNNIRSAYIYMSACHVSYKSTSINYTGFPYIIIRIMTTISDWLPSIHMQILRI